MPCFVRFRQVAVVIIGLALLGGAPAAAQDAEPAVAPQQVHTGLPLELAAATHPLTNAPFASAERRHSRALFEPAPLPDPQHRRPGTLLPLYASFGALQGLDAHSTHLALANGHAEANPLMRGIAGNTAGMIAVKGAATAGVVYAAERMWRRNRTAAVLFMCAANSAMVWVVQHNYRAGR